MTVRFIYAAILAGSVFAQTPEYLPLSTGNQWVYDTSGLGEPLTVEVARSEQFGEQTYYLLRGLPPGDLWLRRLDNGAYVSYDPSSKTESSWIDFSAETGVEFPTSAHPCSTTAVIKDKSHNGKFPVGVFENVTYIQYGANICADAGLTSDFFLPYVGLLQRTETTIAGPRTWSLVYARINDTLVVTAPEVAIGLSVDRAVYQSADLAPGPGRSGSTAAARFSLRSSGGQPVEIVFPTGQTYDFALRDEAGKTLWRWSDGRAFTQTLRRESIQGEKNWAVRVPLYDARGNIFPAGRYTLEAWLATGGEPRWRAQVSFEHRVRSTP